MVILNSHIKPKHCRINKRCLLNSIAQEVFIVLLKINVVQSFICAIVIKPGGGEGSAGCEISQTQVKYNRNNLDG